MQTAGQRAVADSPAGWYRDRTATSFRQRPLPSRRAHPTPRTPAPTRLGTGQGQARTLLRRNECLGHAQRPVRAAADAGAFQVAPAGGVAHRDRAATRYTQPRRDVDVLRGREELDSAGPSGTAAPSTTCDVSDQTRTSALRPPQAAGTCARVGALPDTAMADAEVRRPAWTPRPRRAPG